MAKLNESDGLSDESIYDQEVANQYRNGSLFLLAGIGVLVLSSFFPSNCKNSSNTAPQQQIPEQPVPQQVVPEKERKLTTLEQRLNAIPSVISNPEGNTLGYKLQPPHSTFLKNSNYGLVVSVLPGFDGSKKVLEQYKNAIAVYKILLKEGIVTKSILYHGSVPTGNELDRKITKRKLANKHSIQIPQKFLDSLRHPAFVLYDSFGQYPKAFESVYDIDSSMKEGEVGYLITSEPQRTFDPQIQSFNLHDQKINVVYITQPKERQELVPFPLQVVGDSPSSPNYLNK